MLLHKEHDLVSLETALPPFDLSSAVSGLQASPQTEGQGKALKLPKS